ncbi:class I SAM-dependent methyltransferase [Rhodopirellula sallentina]|uniref:Methyltransferase type 11 n=1 Tax=Rhodopirellula sallentina SM41 TaxID=1263870 RepID=M5U8H9_9BACT|nr:class I SAM-dependent methyltransferase [Rhodopirellula sallentina]EMI52263.1 methyltransferase type 11 [Rhodopirellula sallentina SM41]
MNEVQKQREYYANKATCYDDMCAFNKCDEHYFATAALRGLTELYEIQSLLDVGCGTGRSLSYLRDHCDLELSGIEPVEALRQQCLEKGFSEKQIRVGSADNLDLPDNSVDCVTMFGVLHHVPNPAEAIDEAFRVASKMVFISDHNIYGMGNSVTKLAKQSFRAIGLRRLLGKIMTRGKGFHDTDWDGIFYPFSLLDHFQQMQAQSKHLYSMSTKTPASNLLTQASHVALIALKH